MKENILNLIEIDINISRFLHFQRKYLQVETDKLYTHASCIALSLMLIKNTDQVQETYFELIASSHYLSQGNEIDDLKENIFSYFVSLQRNPDTRIDNLTTDKLGVLTLCYTW